MQAGEMLLSIEAMKMVRALHAEYDGAIADVMVRVGDQIDAKDMLILSPDGAAGDDLCSGDGCARRCHFLSAEAGTRQSLLDKLVGPRHTLCNRKGPSRSVW